MRSTGPICSWASGPSGTFDFDEVSTLAWFPLFNQINRAYAKEPYPLWSVFRHSVVLPLAGFALLMVYWGARFLAHIVGRDPGDP